MIVRVDYNPAMAELLSLVLLMAFLETSLTVTFVYTCPQKQSISSCVCVCVCVCPYTFGMQLIYVPMRGITGR